MANASPCMPSGAMAQVFFPPGGSSPPGSAVMQQGTHISMPMSAHSGFSVMDLAPGQGPGGVVMPSVPPTPAGVSFIIQIGLTRESVLMPQTADLAYVKQIACSIVDTKVGSVFMCVFVRVCVYLQIKEGGMSGKTGRMRSPGGKPFLNCLLDDWFEFLLFPLSLSCFCLPVSHKNLLFTLYCSHG